MIGFQDIIIKRNIKIYEFAKEMGVNPTCVYDWIRNNRIPKNRLKMLSEKLQVESDYLNKKINDIDTYKPKKSGFANKYKVIQDENIAIIYLEKKNGEVYEAVIDIEDLERIKQLNTTWFTRYHKYTRSYYARASVYPEGAGGKCETLYLHRVIMNAEKGDIVDHIDHDTLNTRKSNLRIIRKEDNEKNRKGKNVNNKSGYRNVFWDSRLEKWCVTLCKDNKRIHIGYFDDVHKAGKAAEEARNKYYGDFAGEG